MTSENGQENQNLRGQNSGEKGISNEPIFNIYFYVV